MIQKLGDYDDNDTLKQKLNQVISRVNSLQGLVESQQGLIELNREMIDAIQYKGNTIQKDDKSIQYPFETRVGMLRQWLNEDRITDPDRMVTNEQIMVWLKNNDVTPEPFQQVQNVTQGKPACNPNEIMRILDKHSLVVTNKLAQQAVADILVLMDEREVEHYKQGYIDRGIEGLTV